ncbi:MAG: M35 family metallo-endopeptidase [Collimonas sp.]|uniref:M35 family metallo-endopeptidase n=1 Tax=Collimonas sp. TaxID=1963772 RepID=UPI003266DBD2
MISVQKWLAGVTCLAAIVISGSAYAARADIQVTLQEASAKGDSGAGKVLYTISNTSAAPLHVLKWETPLSGVSGDIFSVALGGQPVRYVGRLVKRKPATDKDYITLKPNESRAVEVDLSAYYEMYRAGQYVVKYKQTADTLVREAGNAVAAKAAGAGASAITLDTTAIPLTVDGGPPPSSKQTSGDLLGAITGAAASGSTSFASCSNSQKTALTTARSDAASIATNAKSYLTANKTGSRYTWWFGAVTSGRYTTATSHYTNIGSALGNQSYKFDCSCAEADTYAYVYPDQPYTVYLCGAYWNAPANGTDSKAGTLVHETSHFTVVAGTGDHVYGQSGAHSLATSDPASALDNADNHEYFAENTPARQ